jgi:DNA-binding transcriptional regulator YiaG
MNWKQLLFHSQKIATELNISVSTIEKWKSNNHVPSTRFASLVPVLAELGHELTTIEMGALNDNRNIPTTR